MATQLILLTIDIDHHHFVLVAVCRPWHEPQLRVCSFCELQIWCQFHCRRSPLTDHFFSWQQKHWFSQPTDLIENLQSFVQFFAACQFLQVSLGAGWGVHTENELLTRSSLYFSKQSLGLRSSSWRNSILYKTWCLFISKYNLLSACDIFYPVSWLGPSWSRDAVSIIVR